MELEKIFNDKHEYLTFKATSDRESYWVGRLVKAKLDMNLSLFERVKADTLGLVLSVSTHEEGLPYRLHVRWMDGLSGVCYQHDVFSYDAHAHVHI